jgi:hypothetical protein
MFYLLPNDGVRLDHAIALRCAAGQLSFPLYTLPRTRPPMANAGLDRRRAGASVLPALAKQRHAASLRQHHSHLGQFFKTQEK